MIAAKAALIAMAIAILGLAPAEAGARSDRAPLTPRALAAAIEVRADRTSFADLARFGEAAARGTGRANLERLQHVAQVFMNQSEFDRFAYFNALLARNAARDHDARYVTIARVNDLQSRQIQGDSSVEREIERIASSEPDWFARVYAMTVAAQIRTSNNHIGPALALMSEAQALIPDHDPYAAAARSYVWETIGIALMGLYDLDGSAAAFDRAEIQNTDPSYPSPDFDAVYNMTNTAVLLGDGALARDLAAAHHRLAARSDLPHLKVWDMYLCADVAESFGTPGQVIDCLAPLDRKLTGGDFLATRILPARAIAEARLGRVAAAREDLARLRKLESSDMFDKAKFNREPEVEAEILLTEGRHVEAFRKLRDFSRLSEAVEAQNFNAGVRQITGELQTQLATARRNVDLRQAVIGNQRWLAALSAMLVVCAGGVVVWQRRVAQRLKIAQMRAEAANRSKSEFLANMSHEIRTPLNGVVGVADLLASSNLNPRQKEMVEIIRSSGQSLARLLSDVLDLARVEAGRMTIEAAPFNAADLVRDVVALSAPAANAKGLDLSADVAPELAGWFMGDAVRTRQILTNLVSNAVKFTDRGRVVITARSAGPDRLRFSVQDTGVGFEAQDKERLFGRFQQADGSITRRFGGTGLGLAISRQLAALMNGEFDCSSEPGKGSLFWFEAPFPRVAAPAPVEETAVSSHLAGDRAIRVLLADDHAINQAVISMMLAQFGALTTTVADGAEAVEAFRKGSFDIVLMDMQMPIMDGLEATRRIRAYEAAAGAARTPLIMLTANALPEHCEASRLAGADGHLAKPITVAELAAALSGALEAEQTERAAA